MFTLPYAAGDDTLRPGNVHTYTAHINSVLVIEGALDFSGCFGLIFIFCNILQPPGFCYVANSLMLIGNDVTVAVTGSRCRTCCDRTVYWTIPGSWDKICLPWLQRTSNMYSV